MVSHALVTFVTIIISVILFSVPLVLKYHVYRPESKTVVVGDVMPVEGRLSSVWCQGVVLESNSKFESFIYDSFPEVDESKVRRTQSVHRMILPDKAQEFWGFHLLRGTKVNLATCARLIRADVTVVRGFNGLQQCLHEYNFIASEMSFGKEKKDSSVQKPPAMPTAEEDEPTDLETLFDLYANFGDSEGVNGITCKNTLKWMRQAELLDDKTDNPITKKDVEEVFDKSANKEKKRMSVTQFQGFVSTISKLKSRSIESTMQKLLSCGRPKIQGKKSSPLMPVEKTVYPYQNPMKTHRPYPVAKGWSQTRPTCPTSVLTPYTTWSSLHPTNASTPSATSPGSTLCPSR